MQHVTYVSQRCVLPKLFQMIPVGTKRESYNLPVHSASKLASDITLEFYTHRVFLFRNL